MEMKEKKEKGIRKVIAKIEVEAVGENEIKMEMMLGWGLVVENEIKMKKLGKRGVDQSGKKKEKGKEMEMEKEKEKEKK